MIEGFKLNDTEFGFSNETAANRYGKGPAVYIHSHSDFDIQDASTSQPTKRRRIVRFDAATVEEKGFEKTPSNVSRKTLPTKKIPTSDLERVHAAKTTPSLSTKSVLQDNSDEKWDEINLFLQFYDIEGVSVDIGTATLEALVKAVKKLKLDNANVGTSSTVNVLKDQRDDYSSTILESDQGEIDAILEGLAAPVYDLPLEVVPPSVEIVNQHHISNIQLPPDFSDAIVVAHQAAKTPAKRNRTKFKVFKSPYMTEYPSGSKFIEDQTGETK
ncbi:hypothetical protein FXO37_31067 [Capsicum annuum]|nr:hypothetical protein FXO37_31067 [Capsicum annuum]